MLHAVPLVLSLLLAPPADPPVPPPDDEAVRGFPEGDPGPLPERVNWDLKRAVTGETKTRTRMTLEGLWRFSAVPTRETPVVRNEMGWIQMPGHWSRGNARAYDARFRVADGLWHGMPLETLPWAWAERDLASTERWLAYRVLLVVGGAWADADVFVQAEPLQGTDQAGTRRFDVTESLIYPGSVPLSMRLHSDPAPDGPDAPAAAADYIGLELVPTGPRVESIELRRDEARGELEVRLALVRPVGIPLRAGAQAVPLAIGLGLDDPDTETTIQKRDELIGSLPDRSRTVTLRITWSAERGSPPPHQARLRVRFGTTSGALYDEPFPVLFEPRALAAVEQEPAQAGARPPRAEPR